MSSVDSRIVTMKFDNAQFEQGASTTMSTLDKLKASLSFTGASKGLSDLAGATGGVESGAARMSAAFIGMSAVAVTAISKITSSVIDMGKNLVAQISGINTVRDGFADYELKIGATQTIMAGTGENIGTVSKYLKELDTYADKTIYSLSDMTSNIGKFTNAGVKLPIAVDAMKGISNAAALSGANAEEASRAMYNFGQAIGQGSVKLMDWRSIELANMGTQEFKQQLIDSAVAMGTLKKISDDEYKTRKGKIVSTKNFTEALKDEWLTSEALTKTLSRYADDTKGIGKRAQAAATEVKTFSMMMETLSAAAGTGWTDTFEILLGNLPEATKLFTGITNAIGGWIGKSADARNKILGDWKELGGRTDLIEGFKNIFAGIGSVLAPIRDAFRDIFPKKTGQQLADATESFRNFTEKLKIGEDTADNLKRIFKGIFSVFSIVWTVIKAVAGAFGSFFGALSDGVSSGGGGILSFSASLADLLTGVDEFLKRTDIIGKVFGAIGTAIGTAIGYIGKLVGALSSLFTGEENPFLDNLRSKFEAAGPIIDEIQAKIQGFVDVVKGIFGSITGLFDFGDDAASSVGGLEVVNASLEDTKTLMDRVKEAWHNFITGFKATGSGLGSGLSEVGKRLGDMWDKIKEMYSNIGLQDILSIINTVFFAAFIKTVRDFIKKIGTGFETVNGFLEGLTDTLSAMQKAIKAKALRDIGLALLAIAVALWILSRIDLPDLAAGLIALVIMLKLMGKTIEEFTTMADGMDKGSAGKIVAMSASLILIGLAMIALATALKILGSIPLAKLVKGVITLGVIMALLVGMADLLEKSGGSAALVRASLALVILSFGLITLSAALLLWDQLDASTILDSIWKVVLVVGGIGAAMRAFPEKGALKAAAAMLIMSAALVIMAFALNKIGNIGILQLAKSLGTLAIVLALLVVAMEKMDNGKQGAVALLLAAAAIGILALSLKLLSSIPWQGMLLALGSLAAAFIILGVAGYVLGPVVVVIHAIAAALLLMGLAMLAAGAGMVLFAIGLVALSTLGTAALIALIELLPVLGTQIGLAMIAWAKVIGDSAPVIGEAVYKVIKAMIDTAMRVLPLLPPLVKAMIDTWLEIMKDAVPKIARAALQWLLDMLTAIRNNMYRITTVTLEIITEFLEGLAKGLPDLIEAGKDVIVAWLKGIGDRENVKEIADAAIEAVTGFINGTIDALEDPENQAKIKEAGSRLGGKLVSGFVWGLTNATPLGLLARAGRTLVNTVTGAAEDEADSHSPSMVFYRMGGDFVQGLANGLYGYAYLAEDASTQLVKDSMGAMKSTMSKISDVVESDIDPNPVIAPVLDLDQFRKDAAKMNAQFKDVAITADVSLRQATSISNDRRPEQTSATEETSTPPATVIQFEQNNYSPKELSAIEIYRQTKNQLSLAKGALSA